MVTLSGERSTWVKRAHILNGVRDLTSDHGSRNLRKVFNELSRGALLSYLWISLSGESLCGGRNSLVGITSSMVFLQTAHLNFPFLQ